jgi:F-type H+-transporting ATPase subunit epsilon
VAEKCFMLEIVTPTKVLYSGEAVSFRAPGVMGGFQVLWNHAPLLAEIGVGEVMLRQPDGKELRFATSGGYCEVLHNHVTMIAETAERSDEIDRPRAESAKTRARKEISDKLTGPDVDEARLRWSGHGTGLLLRGKNNTLRSYKRTHPA